MTDVDFRRLPAIPVEENVPMPATFSQTLLKHANVCPRSAYLYLKYRGGPPSMEMHRGSLFHIFAARLVVELIAREERSLLEATGGNAGDVADITRAMMNAIVEEHPELTVSAEEMDVLRRCAFHLGAGLDVDPQTVLGLERRFELDLEGRRLVGVIDLLAMPDAVTLAIDDYKTTMAVLTEEQYATSFQHRDYALLALEGRPVEWVDCSGCWGKGVEYHDGDPRGELCSLCKGKRGGWADTGEPGIAAHVRYVVCRELYPRVDLRPDGRLTHRAHTLSRTEVSEFRADLLRVVQRVERGVETGEWPAMRGSWCSECPAEMECPLPRHLRRYAGAVQTQEEASEALEWAEAMSARVAATRAEVRNFSKASGPVRVGNRVFDFRTSHYRELRKGKGRSWDALEMAMSRHVRFGEPFLLEEWVKTTTKTEFKAVREEVADANDGAGIERDDSEGGRDERWGADAPF